MGISTIKTFTYTIKYRGRGPTREEFLTKIAAEHNFRVLNETPESIEVETGRGGLGWLRYRLPGWQIEKVSETRKTVSTEVPKKVTEECKDLDDLWDL